MDTIKIQDLTSESSLSILALIDDKQTEVPIKMAVLTEDEMDEDSSIINGPFVPLDVIVHEMDKKFAVISFQNARADIQLIAVHDGEIYKWDNVMVTMIQLENGKKIHLCKLQNSKGTKFNRRRGVRLPLDQAMEVQQKGTTYKVIVRDLSYCGIGLLERGESKLDVKEPFILFLSERNKDKEVIVGKITAKIIRQEKTENGDTISGCITAKGHYNFLQRYIAIKQMERIKGESMNGVQRTCNNENWRYTTAKELGRDLI